jgi:tRNA 2-thiouridine synthesizing protein E
MTDDNLEAVMSRIDALAGQVAYLVDRQHKTEELFAEMMPIAREVIRTTTAKFDELEKKGYFAFGGEVVKVAQRVVESYSPSDVRQLGDAVVGILDTVRAMTQPEVLAVMGEASEVLHHADAAQPIGLIGMVRATRSEDVQRGMAIVMELLKKVGKGAHAVGEKQREQGDRKAKLAAVLGPRRNRQVLGIERPVPALPPRSPASRPAQAPPAHAGCAVPMTTKAEVATVLDGVGFGADGHLVDASVWTKALAESIAAMQGVALGEAHWKVVEFARADFTETKVSPNIRRLTQGTGLTTKDLYALFPKAPGRTIAKIAGLPKPAGCI